MRRIDRHSSQRLIVAGLLDTFVLLLVARDFWSTIAIQIVLGFPWATPYVGLQKFINAECPETALAGGRFNSITSRSSIVEPVLGGFLAIAGYAFTFDVSTGTAPAAFGVFVAMTRPHSSRA